MPLLRRLTLAFAATLLVLAAHPAAGLAACANPVACENEKPGTAPSVWQGDNTDPSIQGYATSMSVNAGGTIRFKVKTTASRYHIDIYRLGYYQGNGARLQAGNVQPSASLPQSQPSCLTESSTGLIDCGNWGVSASWTVPAASVSGVYLARLMRDDTGGASQIPFVVRNDVASSDMLVRTSDATWQAYNAYGGNSLYTCTVACPPGSPAAYKGAFSVSYNRPFDGTVQDNGRSYLFYAEYQMIRFIERNGYDVSYTSQADTDANAAALRNHKIIVSSAHDEYWSGRERTNIEAARDAGVSLAFFSGNEVFWKTRWQSSSADGTATQYRTLTTYKDTHFDAPTDPVAWTGTWRDPRFTPPADGGRPENSMTGQLFIVNAGTSDITVPAAYKNLRLWRNTAVANLAAGQTRTLSPGGDTLGYEWDIDVDNGFRPAGEFQLSSTTVGGLESFIDYGSNVASPTTQTHHLTMYKASSGALVFGAGTVQWAWGLDVSQGWSSSGPPASAPDPVMQQATINLFADMGAQATTLMSSMAPASASTDTAPPSSTITTPTAGAAIADGTQVTISGSSTDASGQVAGVEVSTDDGRTWHPATGTTSWTYTWNAHGAPSTNIKARAVDDSGNLETAVPSVSVSVGCPCTIAGSSTVPKVVDQGDTNAVELGMRFKADLDGSITGVRFYKSAANTGTHVGNLWTTSGTLLATGTFSGESTSGWQQMTFTTPVDITAGTTYIASYFAPRGHYSSSPGYFFQPSPTGSNALDSPPLHAISANGGVANGLYSYAGSSTFPTSTFNGENYGVDVTFVPKLPPGPVGTPTATPGTGSATVSFSAPVTGGPPTRYVVTPFIGSTAQAPTTVTGTPPATSVRVSGLDPVTFYTFKVQAANGSGTSPSSAASNAVMPLPPTAPDAPTGVTASGQNRQATVRWTAPSDGGATITRYTITPYLNGVVQATTPVTGSPAPTTGVVSGLTNGSAYTFTVSATNSVGTSGDSAPSNAVTPQASPQFVQRVSGRTAATTLQLTPASVITTGNRIVVMAGAWSNGGATISGVIDSAGNAYTKLAGQAASDHTELSVWSAPITAGGGTKPTVTVTATGSADIGGAALEYSGLSAAAGAAAVDQFKTATGTSSSAGFVTSGPTAALTGDNGLAMGFYVDSGFGRTLTADPSYTERVNVSPTSDMEFVAEDALPLRGDTPAARVATGANTPWLMATVVFKTGVVAPPPPPVLSTAPASLSFSATAGGSSPAAKTISVSNTGGGSMSWTASDSASWLSVSPASGTNGGTVTVTPSITGLAAGTYTTDVVVTAAGVSGSPNTIPVTLTLDPPTPPALSVSPAALSFSAVAGGPSPAAKTLSVSNTGGGSLDWTASESASWLSVSPASGTNAGTVTVTPSITGLAAGTYTEDITLAAAGATGSPKTVTVTLTLDPPTPPALSVSPAALSFSATQGGASPAAKTLSISNTGGGSLDWTASESASWLGLAPSSGTNSGTVTVTPSIGGLTAGNYTEDITLAAAGATGSPKTVTVTLTVDPPPPPVLSVTPATLAFTATQGGTDPAAKTVSVSNTGSGSMSWTASESATWLSVSPGSGTNAGTVTATPTIAGLAVGTYTTDVTFTAPGATGSPKTVTVTLTVGPQAPSNLVGAWGFDDTSATTTADASGRGNTGTINGPVRSAAGKYGGALSFDGINDWVTVADADSLDLTTGMTLEGWVRPTVVGTAWRTVILKEQPNALIYALYAGNGKGRAASDVFTSSDLGISGTTNTPLNAWTHLAATYDGTTQRLLVNGVQVATKAVTGPIKVSTGALRFGGNNTWNDEWFAGLLDELRVYNRALSATEIQADMARPVN